jgi:hypothetical protein
MSPKPNWFCVAYLAGALISLLGASWSAYIGNAEALWAFVCGFCAAFFGLLLKIPR